MKRLPRVLGWTLALLHLVLVIAIACSIASAHARGNHEASMGWIVVMFLSYPVVRLFPVVAHLLPTYPDISFLPGITGNWSEFLFPLVFFSLVGSAWWFGIGWVLGRVICIIRQRQVHGT